MTAPRREPQELPILDSIWPSSLADSLKIRHELVESFVQQTAQGEPFQEETQRPEKPPAAKGSTQPSGVCSPSLQ
jgi:hypothetical protein